MAAGVYLHRYGLLTLVSRLFFIRNPEGWNRISTSISLLIAYRACSAADRLIPVEIRHRRRCEANVNRPWLLFLHSWLTSSPGFRYGDEVIHKPLLLDISSFGLQSGGSALEQSLLSAVYQTSLFFPEAFPVPG
jgi:hypothetical protein